VIGCVADTHAALWFVFADARLSRPAREFMLAVGSRGDQVAVPSISLIETLYLEEKGRVPAGTLGRFLHEVDRQPPAFTVYDLSRDVALALRHISRAAVPDMPDRVIAATALHLHVPLVSRDRHIRAAGLQTIW
jgi:PIN domain nuclease of toxin-antitoxin system